MPVCTHPRTDLGQAAQILAGAGVEELSLRYSYGVGEVEQEQIGQVWKANLASIGVDLVLERLPGTPSGRSRRVTRPVPRTSSS